MKPKFNQEVYCMGDRANVVVKESGEQVCLYTHWSGYELPGTLRSAMKRGESRLDDSQYLARIIFCEMVRGREMDTTGFGISQNIGDGGNQVIVVDVDNATVTINDNEAMTFSDFMSGSAGW
jgi:hypothetical protein